jgi:hypothetical protein
MRDAEPKMPEPLAVSVVQVTPPAVSMLVALVFPHRIAPFVICTALDAGAVIAVEVVTEVSPNILQLPLVSIYPRDVASVSSKKYR